MPGMDMSAQGTAAGAGLESYAGAAPANADAIATAHKAFPATLPAAAGLVAAALDRLVQAARPIRPGRACPR